MKEKTIYKNKKGEIICITDNFGNNKYVLLDANGNYKKELYAPFNVKDYL